MAGRLDFLIRPPALEATVSISVVLGLNSACLHTFDAAFQVESDADKIELHGCDTACALLLIFHVHVVL